MIWIWLAGLHAGQGTAHVDLVNENLEIQGVAGIGIGGLGLVAHDAKLNVAAGTAVRRQARRSGAGGHTVRQSVAGVAIGGADNVPRRRCAARRHEVVSCVGVIRPQIPLGQVSRTVDSDAVSRRGIESRRRFGGESINIFAHGDGLGSTARVSRGLSSSSSTRGRRHCADYVRGILFLPLWNVSCQKTQGNGAGSDYAGPVESGAVRIRQFVIDTDGAV